MRLSVGESRHPASGVRLGSGRAGRTVPSAANAVKVVVLDDYQGAVRGLSCLELLDGHELTVLGDRERTADEVERVLAEAVALVPIRERTRIDGAFLARMPQLRLIAQTGRGTAHIDLAACGERGVLVSTSTGSPVAPAELTFGLVLASLRHIPREAAALRSGHWQQTLGTRLRGRTLGILGYGSIGALVASYGAAFGMHVLAWGREGSRLRAAADGREVAATRAELFSRSDVLSLHLKLTPETRGSITAADLGAMKPTALLVNTSRAELIAPGALASALRAGRPGRAAVDVFDREPARPGDEPLLALENVLCTPHLGFVEEDTYEQYFADAFARVASFAAGDLTAPDPETPPRR